MDIKNLTNLVGVGAQADVYGVGDKAIKLFKEQYPKEEVFREAALHAKVESTELSIPKIYEVVQIENRMGIVMEMVIGESLMDMALKDTENMNFYLDTMIDLQMEMHNVEALGFPDMKERFVQRINKSEILDVGHKQKLIKLIHSFGDFQWLCHGDFHFANIINSHGNLKLIDWIDVTCGNPEADVCRTYLIYKFYLEKYADMYLSQYCEKANKTKGAILRWLPIIAAVRLSENNENEKEQLLKWVNID